MGHRIAAGSPRTSLESSASRPALVVPVTIKTMQPSQLLWQRGNGAVSICVKSASLDPYTSGVFTRTSNRHTMKWIIAAACRFRHRRVHSGMRLGSPSCLMVRMPVRLLQKPCCLRRQQCVEWPEALANSWVRQCITCECRASGDVSEESGAVSLVLVVEHGFPRKCLIHHQWQFVTFERAATREPWHGRP